MTRLLTHIFIDHPASVEETYAQHFWFALRFAALLFAASGAALVHAFVPCLFEKTASRILKTLSQRVVDR
ncbi:DUF6356 family protein [Tropicimonas sp. S265A]|uniref:DUF6356 family protein n=1 Tax=Tropicimonas sp. S265A TaxID=3415134 RepID=UPI003C7C0446